MREVKHKTEWVELRPAEEAPEEDGAEIDDETEGRPRRRIKNAREELRKKLRAQGISPSTNLRLYIEKYLHSDSNTGGSYAETEFCTKYETTEDHILNKDYIDVARRWGAGKYRITIRMQNKIADAFDERISATPTGSMIQNINPNDPTSPQFIIQTTNNDGQQSTQPMSMRDIMKGQKDALKEHLEMTKLMREAYGFAPEQSQQPKTEEEILSSAILNRPEVLDNVVGSVIKKFGGKSDNDEPWYADVFRDAVKSGQLVQVVSVAIDRIFNGLGGMFPGRQNNGQAPVGAETIPHVANTQNANPQESRPALPTLPEGQGAGAVQETVGNVQGSEAQRTMSPEDQALQLLIEHCRRNIPAEIACDRLISFADAINDQAPHLSIDRYISMFAAMPVETALEFVKSQPNGEQVASLPHAQQWTAELQRLIKEAGQESEEA